jgi:hypothetical protein
MLVKRLPLDASGEGSYVLAVVEQCSPHSRKWSGFWLGPY